MHHNRLPNTIDYGGDLLVTSFDQPALQRQLALKGCNFRQLAFIFHRPAPPRAAIAVSYCNIKLTGHITDRCCGPIAIKVP